MKIYVCTLALMLPLGCKDKEEPSPPAKQAAKAVAAASKPAVIPAALGTDYEGEADTEIDETNFESELEALEKEIDTEE